MDLELVPADAMVSRLMAMPLDQFGREGQLLEVRVPWLDATLWFVPEEWDAEALVREGVSRGRVWTATELMDVMAIGGLTREALRTIALGKLTFDGHSAAVIPRSEDDPRNAADHRDVTLFPEAHRLGANTDAPGTIPSA